MDIICSNYPDLAQQIFCNLDNENLVKCKVVSKTWSEFIEKEKFLPMRFIIEYINNHKDYKEIWRFTLRRSNTKMGKEIRLALKAGVLKPLMNCPK